MNNQSDNNAELADLCVKIRALLPQRKYLECESLLSAAMRQYPHAPQPHNLYGLLFEAKGEHRMAMNHFRAAWALDGTYKPAQHNLNHFGTFYSKGVWAYDESDCADDDKDEVCKVERDKNGIGRVIHSIACEIKRDSNGIGHIKKREAR